MASSIRELAAITGFSTATVSLALRNSPRISPETRKLIQNAAEDAGYTTTPIMSKALSMARQRKSQAYHETLAAIMEYPLKSGHGWQRSVFDSALKRAQALGYHLEGFVATYERSNHRSISRIMQNRGIRGVVIFPRLDANGSELYLQWEHFAAVEINRTLHTPDNLHKVDRPIYYELLEAFEAMINAGYSRIGMAVEPEENALRRGVYSAAYLMFNQQCSKNKSIPVFGNSGQWSYTQFSKWIRFHKPEIIIVHEPNTIPEWLNRMGLEVPKDISYFSMNAMQSHATGYYSDLSDLAKYSIDFLTMLLEHNELGLPEKPRNLMISDDFKSGTTTSLPLDLPFHRLN